ncbi:MAG: hypothetical protein IPL26_12790 [Leptospiraceae bacterium]|nr:hypothetical protein [Leptospiraceae bacterium]
MNFKTVYQDMKSYSEFTVKTLVDKYKITRAYSNMIIKRLSLHGMIEKKGSVFSDAGHEMYVYRTISDTQCRSCKTKDVRLYQHNMCANCLHYRFKKSVNLINMIRG